MSYRHLHLVGLLAALPAGAQTVSFHGYADARLVASGDERSWIAGGLGKLRYGGEDGTHFGGAALQAAWQIAPELLGVATLQYQRTDAATLDVPELWLRWRPVSTSRWRWSAKGGVFFAPISLENDGVGWTSPYTLTPSAINSWVGEELRTFGVEARVEWRGDTTTLEAAGALYTANDPAGEILAVRGWALHDLTAGWGSTLREPDVIAPVIGASVPVRFDPFVEIDERLGWYAELAARSAAYGRYRVLRYDNRADPTQETAFGDDHDVYAWRTRFWSAGVQKRVGDVELLAQAMDGSTDIAPSPFFASTTKFRAAYALAAWERGPWAPALRVDVFGTHEYTTPPGPGANEHGRAVTAALNWRPHAHVRVIGEVVRVASARTQRADAGLPERSTDTQVQLAVRFVF
jgi:hypothetical protein